MNRIPRNRLLSILGAVGLWLLTVTAIAAQAGGAASPAAAVQALVAPFVTVVDTTGAGDAFAAGFISAELAGADEAACLARGIAAGSEAVKQLGGQPD